MNLLENPISMLPGYRLLVIKNLPDLEKLDDVVVTHEEKQAAMQLTED